MDLYAKGQLSFLILNCLLERDFYGLDFISEIYNKSNGKIELKKPSVYSNLNRMESQGYVSSYLKSSDLGPNRKYYSITEKGREFYQDLKDYFDRNNINVFKDFSENNDTKNNVNIVNESANNASIFDKNISFSNESYKDSNSNINTNLSSDNDLNSEERFNNEEDLENYFDFSELDSKNENKKDKINDYENKTNKAESFNPDSPTTDNKVDTNTYSIKSLFTTTNINSSDAEAFVDKVNREDEKNNKFSNIKIESLEDNNTTNENEIYNTKELNNFDKTEKSTKDDGVFLNSKDVEEYNKRLYDISKDFNKYKRKKSFAEEQIAIQVDSSSPISESKAKTESNIEEFKNSILQNKGKYSENNNYDYSKQNSYIYNKNTKSYQDVLNKDFYKKDYQQNLENNLKDDGKFITNRIDDNQIGYAKKIEPPKIKIVNESNKENYKMPPPKRDTSIDPSHKEILSKLYSKTRSSVSNEVREDALYDYGDLTEFYQDQNISFNVYKKPAEKIEHNTNKLYLIISLITFLLSSILSAVLYGILLKCDCINRATNFLFILLPSLILIDIGIKFYNYKKYQSWMPNPMLQQWKLWVITFICIALVVALNFIFGLSPLRFGEFATTTILPIIFILIELPFRYYLKRFLLIKYWK